MSIRIFTIACDPKKELFSDEDFSQFLLNKYVKKLHPELFFQIDDRAFWTVFVEYETISETDKSGSDDLNEAEKLILKSLKEWRKEKVEKQGFRFLLSPQTGSLWMWSGVYR